MTMIIIIEMNMMKIILLNKKNNEGCNFTPVITLQQQQQQQYTIDFLVLVKFSHFIKWKKNQRLIKVCHLCLVNGVENINIIRIYWS